MQKRFYCALFEIAALSHLEFGLQSDNIVILDYEPTLDPWEKY